MGYSIWPFEYWLQRYREAGLRVIPIYGETYPDGFYNEKAVGIHDWPNYVANDNDNLASIRLRFRWCCVTGKASNHTYVIDYDLQKHTDASGNVVENVQPEEFWSVKNAKRWRNEHLWQLRDMDTLVTFTPSGGCHVWIRCPRGAPDPRDTARLTYGVFPCQPDLIRGNDQQVLIPPSRLIEKGYYLFMDQDEILPNLKDSIRIVR